LRDGHEQFDVNIFGMGRLIQLVLPHMRAQHDGYIVNISSVGGKMWEPMGSWYHATKFAVEGLSDSLRAEVAAFLASDEGVDALRTELRDSVEKGITAVPTFVFEGRFAVPGAQDPDTMLLVLQRVAEKLSAPTS
jgi:NAD(P)-dependent dehydrogenase (short-subunit alcohol dehydrogenase family)